MNSKVPATDSCSCGGRGCACCQGIEALTPQSTANRPGLSALRYRVGTHGSFLETMKARLSGHVLAEVKTDAENAISEPKRPLAELRTRESGDAAIALLDAWATVADVLTFYQERIANEGYLRTATEMRSMFELSRLVGYQPRPGVASSVYLAYTIDANTTQEIVVPKGARAQTVPGQDELPQSFETSEDLKARAAWNRLGLRQTEPQQWDDAKAKGEFVLYLAGTQTRLRVGDPLLIESGKRTPGQTSDSVPAPYRVLNVEPDADADHTTVRVEPWDRSHSTRAIEASLLVLSSSGPEGKVADEVRNALVRLRDIDRDDPLFASSLDQVRALVRVRQSGLGSQRAPRLRSWLAEVASAINGLTAIAATASASDSRDPPLLKDRIRRLITPGSKPRLNALQLPRSLSSGFEKIGDAGLKVLGAVAPELKATLAPALAGYEAASPRQPIRVWALRLRSGVFGRTFPRRTKTQFERRVQTSETIDVGEWPIVVVTKPLEGDPELVRQEESVDTLYLDASYDGIAPDSWLFVDASAVPAFDDKTVMVKPAKQLLVTLVKRVFPKISRALYGGSGDSTGLFLDTAKWISFTGELTSDQDTINRDFQIIRRTTVYAQSEELTLAERPIEEPLCGGSIKHGERRETDLVATVVPSDPIELDGLYTDLEPGRFVIVSGERSDIGETRGVFASEPVMVTAVVHDVRAAGPARGPWTHIVEAAKSNGADDGGQAHEPAKLPGDKNHTFIWIDKPLAYCYRRESVAILANVVKATHGETRNETLGNGDGAKPLQRFDLKQFPLTHLSASTPTGAESTLDVYVNDVRWHEACGFVGQGPTDNIYLVQTDEQGKAVVQFGNGREGARLPTGIGNVRAAYRNGIGRPGNVRAGQIQQLATRPLGVKEVTNPLRASGGADRESREQVRRNAPLAVKSLDRLVSTIDYADFSRTFAGIGKADAQEISDGRRSLVHLTVAGVDDIPIDIDSDLLINLRRALRDFGDPFQPLTVVPRELRLLIVSANLRIDLDYLWEPVVSNVRNALLHAFGFEQRDLAQGVASSEILRVIQAVPGVQYVDLDAFGAIDTVIVDGNPPSARPVTPDETAAAVGKVVVEGVAPAVQAFRARRSLGSGTVLPAQLALLSAEVAETLVLNQLV